MSSASPLRQQLSAPNRPAPVERLLFFWQFENGSYIKITVSGDVPSEDIVWAAEHIIALKRAEIARRAARANGEPSDLNAPSTEGRCYPEGCGNEGSPVVPIHLERESGESTPEP